MLTSDHMPASDYLSRGALPPKARGLHLHLPEVWIRFLLAIVGLGLAFAAALFSTVSRESGHLWTTLVLASLALLLATIVGITTVPYLASRVAVARVRDALDYEVTRVGITYVLGVIVLGIAAVNTGNNLLYIVVAAMLSAIVVSGIASAAVLRGLRLDLRVPEYVFAGTPVKARLTVRNPRRWASFSISVVPGATKKARARWRWTPATIGFPPKRPPSQQWITLPDRRLGRVLDKEAMNHILAGNVYFPYIAARTEARAEVELRFERRGRFQQDGFGLATRFPFAFLTKTRRIALAKEIVVFPSVEPTGKLLEVLPLITGEFESFVRGRGHDLYRIREYTHDDSARHVDWKATAKSGSLKVREFSREDERKLRIVFDNPAPETASDGDVAYEDAVSLVASLSWHFAQENAELSFVAPGYTGQADIYRFLGHLATIKPASEPSLLDSLPLSDDYNLVVTFRPRGTIPARLWACSYFVFAESVPSGPAR